MSSRLEVPGPGGPWGRFHGVFDSEMRTLGKLWYRFGPQTSPCLTREVGNAAMFRWRMPVGRKFPRCTTRASKSTLNVRRLAATHGYGLKQRRAIGRRRGLTSRLITAFLMGARDPRF